MFLRWVAIQAAERTGVAKDRKRTSGEAWKVARGILLVGGEEDEKQSCEESIVCLGNLQ